MRSKLQHTLTELHKIHNQIRVQLNQVRYTRELEVYDKSPRASKRIFHDKIAPTSLFGNSQDLHTSRKVSSKKTFDTNNIKNADFNKTVQRRHYEDKFQDKVQLSLSPRKSTSPYFRVKTQSNSADCNSKSAGKQSLNTSLPGVGGDERQLKRGIRIIHSYHTFNSGLI